MYRIRDHGWITFIYGVYIWDRWIAMGTESYEFHTYRTKQPNQLKMRYGTYLILFFISTRRWDEKVATQRSHLKTWKEKIWPPHIVSNLKLPFQLLLHACTTHPLPLPPLYHPPCRIDLHVWRLIQPRTPQEKITTLLPRFSPYICRLDSSYYRPTPTVAPTPPDPPPYTYPTYQPLHNCPGSTASYHSPVLSHHARFPCPHTHRSSHTLVLFHAPYNGLLHSTPCLSFSPHGSFYSNSQVNTRHCHYSTSHRMQSSSLPWSAVFSRTSSSNTLNCISYYTGLSSNAWSTLNPPPLECCKRPTLLFP